MASTALTADVGNPEVLREILRAHFRPGAGSLQDLVEAHWTPDATFKTPMFTVNGKANLNHLFHFWQNVFDDQLDILDVAAQGNKVMVRIRHNLAVRPVNIVRHLLPAPLHKLLNFPLSITATLTTEQTARGRRISGWFEDVSVYTLIYNLAWWNKLVNVHDDVELALGQAIITADQAGRTAYHLTAPYLLPALDRGLQTADSLAKQYLGWDLGLHRNSRHIWA